MEEQTKKPGMEDLDQGLYERSKALVEITESRSKMTELLCQFSAECSQLILGLHQVVEEMREHEMFLATEISRYMAEEGRKK